MQTFQQGTFPPHIRYDEPKEWVFVVGEPEGSSIPGKGMVVELVGDLVQGDGWQVIHVRRDQEMVSVGGRKYCFRVGHDGAVGLRDMSGDRH